MVTGEEQCPWADICPDLLNSIYRRLPSHIDGTQFSCVCKNWHQIHSEVVLSNPLHVDINRTKFSNSDVVEVREDDKLFVKPCRKTQIPERLVGVSIKILGRAGAWFLIKERGIFLGCYNPLLRRPANYIALPDPSLHFSHYRRNRTPVTVKVAFSALPTARDSMILMVYGDLYLSVLRCGDDWMWKTYNFSLARKKGQTCLGVGYGKGRFFCLFEMGDMVIFSTDKNETRMLLVATKPLLLEHLEQWDSLRVVAVVTKKATSESDQNHELGKIVEVMIVTHWERDHEARDKDNFRLVAVVEKVITMTDLLLANDDDDCEIVSMMEDGDNNKGLIVVKEWLPLKRSFHGFYLFTLYFLSSLLLLLGTAWIILLAF
ncbi:unnamed protein product [Linum trigynum]|uniref:KIB1-4 beta-propeller domain-containing protein n=1 Tax=Linum trigynum TaxID=586398 RepID=A0AAV2F0I7_9ROSI